MALMRWSPWQGLLDLQREMDDVVRRTTTLFGNGTGFGSVLMPRTGSWVPAVDVFHRGDDLVIRGELPGINPEEDVDISVLDNVLWIRGERRQEERTNGEGGHMFESSYGSFQRGIPLPDGVKTDKITANYEDGILEVIVPGAAELTGAKQIPIKVGSKRQALTVGRKKR